LHKYIHIEKIGWIRIRIMVRP